MHKERNYRTQDVRLATATDRILRVGEEEGLTDCLTAFMEKLVSLGVFAKQDLDPDVQMSWIRGVARTVKDQHRPSPMTIRTSPVPVVSTCSDCGATGSCTRAVLETEGGGSVRTLCSTCLEARRTAELEPERVPELSFF